VSRRFALFANPKAAGGRALDALRKARGELDARGAEYRVVETTGVEHVRTAAADAARDGETVVAIGGDGLVGCIAGVLRETAGSLAIVPGGRGNDFARVLEIPFDAVEATRVALEGEERMLDLGYVDGSPFVGIASLGFDSDANRIANDAKLVRGNLVYLYAALRALAGWKHARFEVTVDGKRHEFTGYTVAIGNSKAYGGGMFLFPQAKLDDGRLEVLMCRAYSKLRWLRDIPTVFKGTHGENPYVTFASGQEVEVRAERRFVVYADGDPIGALPVTVTVAKQVLRVIVPRS
jgi:YegS/Rv2252/BmrU family lipid kinase